MDGISCSAKFAQPGAGVIYVNKLARNSAKAPKAPGGDFTHRETSTDQKAIYLNNVFQESDKVRNIVISQIAADTDLQQQVMENVILSGKENYQVSMTAKVVAEATKGTAGALATYDAFKTAFIAARKTLRTNKVKPDFIIVSTDVYSQIISAAGTEFLPNTNEEIQRTGVLGRYRGINLIEGNLLDGNSAAQYLDAAAATKTVDLTKVGFIMGGHEYVSTAVSLEMARVINAIDFNGVLCQLELATGTAVLDAERVYVHPLSAITVTEAK